MASESKRPLYKGPLLPPKREAWTQSYTVNAVSEDQIRVKSGKGDRFPVIEFRSGDVPMPFLDPTIIPRRVQEEKEWNAKQERDKKVESSSQGG
ncbi:hypothetical protein BKA65DRAFT_556897 [Rhexocercosporidium sp. MPI-PUGE-AT-0058]|nr:hypothetical protein BKA65DRAFT_556897 [Rhexocercosporidium sp. MPI-PUGE-AT-0058]